jgi:S1-C subfamily serine protease
VLAISVFEKRSENTFHAKGGRIRIGRWEECELRPVQTGDTSVSRVHAEIVLLAGSRVVVRDAQSRNGTFVNGARLTRDHVLALGDRIMLGDAGPDLLVEALQLPGEERQDLRRRAAAARREGGPPPPAANPPRRSFGGKGKTLFFREMMEESSRKSASRVRVAVWSFVLLLAGATGAFYWYADQQQRRTELQLEEQGRALAAASERTEALESALRRAAVAGDSMQRSAQGELARLQRELTQAAANSATHTVDSLRSAVRDQERRNAVIAAQVRAVKGVNLAAIAEASGPAVGLVTGYRGTSVWDGSGFVITSSGYFVTNRHVATDRGLEPDSLFVVLADQRIGLRADLVAVPPGENPDVALLKIRNYSGPVVSQVNWLGLGARQGEAAALIGYPAAYALGWDPFSGTVKTSMAAGIFAQVTDDGIRFDGFSVGGSSGSPLFNADGEVVGVHRAGLRDSVAEGQRRYGFSVPIRQLIPLLPPDAKAELGLQ